MAPRGKTKPTAQKLGCDWCQDTLDWFNAWRKSERTDGWDEPQWQYMKDVGTVHDMIYGQGMIELMPELQRRLEFLGLGFEPPRKQAERPKSQNGQLLKFALENGKQRNRGEAG